ncbi:MAG TPA: DUF1905 domain-containing protein, partial [Bacteroidia bacterium]|nr:DUF1905 domain-containing protein [Bacteroidia bacterium]
MSVQKFKAVIEIIGINPFVFLPEKILAAVFKQAKKDKGPITVDGTIDGKPYTQTLVKYAGAWRLYVNTPMMKASGRRVGDLAVFTIAYDSRQRVVGTHPKLKTAFAKNKQALKVFESLAPSRQKEIKRYINNLKTEEAIDKNVKRAIEFEFIRQVDALE